MRTSTLAFLLLAGAAQAQVRVYEPSTTQAPSLGGVRTVPAASATPAAKPPAVQIRQAAPMAPATNVARERGQTSVPHARDIGSAMVFIRAPEFSSTITTRVKEIARVPGLSALFVIQDEDPRKLVGLIESNLKDMPDGVEFKVDLDAKLAASYDAINKNVIVYRDPTGTVRHYNLVSEYAAFLNHIQRLRGR